MNDLIREIQELSREGALEALGFVNREVAPGGEAHDAERRALEPIVAQPYQNIEEIEQLAKLVLISAALVPEYEETVRNAVSGVGRKQYILGGAEVVALAVVGLYALKVVLAKGQVSRHETIKIEEKDGKTTTHITRDIKYGVGPGLGSILKGYFGGGG